MQDGDIIAIKDAGEDAQNNDDFLTDADRDEQSKRTAAEEAKRNSRRNARVMFGDVLDVLMPKRKEVQLKIHVPVFSDFVDDSPVEYDTQDGEASVP